MSRPIRALSRRIRSRARPTGRQVGPAEQVQAGVDGRQWAAQLVAGVGDEPALASVAASIRSSMVFMVVASAAISSVGGGDRQPGVQVAGGDRVGLAAHRLDRAQRAPDEQERGRADHERQQRQPDQERADDRLGAVVDLVERLPDQDGARAVGGVDADRDDPEALVVGDGEPALLAGRSARPGPQRGDRRGAPATATDAASDPAVAVDDLDDGPVAGRRAQVAARPRRRPSPSAAATCAARCPVDWSTLSVRMSAPRSTRATPLTRAAIATTSRGGQRGAHPHPEPP